MTREEVVVGVDAGGTATDVAVVSLSGELRALASGGPGDIYAGGDLAVTNVRLTLERAITMSGGLVRGSALRLAGVSWPEDAAYWRDRTATWDLGPAVSILDHGFAPIRLAAPDGVGVAAIAGTHAAFAARGPEGTEFSLGKWSMHELGAYGLADVALRRAALAHLGLAPPTDLGIRIAAMLNHQDLGSILHASRNRHPTLLPRDIARVASTVSSAARDGDRTAVELVTSQASLFADYVVATARAVGFGLGAPVRVALSGGTLRPLKSPWREHVLRELRARMPQAVLRVDGTPPVAGAVLDALASLDIPIAVETLGRLLDAIRRAGTSSSPISKINSNQPSTPKVSR